MKKIILFAVIAAILNLTACDIFDGFVDVEVSIQETLEESKIYPIYSSLDDDEKEVYVKICSAIENFNDSSFLIGEYDSRSDARDAEKRVADIYKVLIYEQPQYFWVNPYQYGISIREYDDKYNLLMCITYLMDEDEAEEKKEKFDRRVSEIVSEAKTKRGIFERVLYVYDEILDSTVYDYDLADEISAKKTEETQTDVAQSAYGCLVEGKTVCSGYSLAFNLIMQKLGFECGADFNMYNGQLSIMGAHVWNYCKLDGEYYYFDLTWDDNAITDIEYNTHQYFAITTDEMAETHPLSNKTVAPKCEGTQFDYFIYNDMYFEEYDYIKVKKSIREQLDNKCIALKFSDYSQVLKAERDLIDDEKIYSLIGKDRCSYFISKSSKHLYIIVD